jgi:hypothetical protein
LPQKGQVGQDRQKRELHGQCELAATYALQGSSQQHAHGFIADWM